MADEILILDAAASNVDGTNPGTALQIGPGTSYGLVAHSYPSPPLNVQYASSVDTEGEVPVSRRYQNRTITIQLSLAPDATDALLEALQLKFAKLQREGGTLKRTMKNGDVRIYDIVAGDGWDPAYDLTYVLGDVAEVSLVLPAKPFSRGVEQDLGDNTETTLPSLIFSEATIDGDVEALGRLVIDDDSGVAQINTLWGIESNRRYTHTSSSGAGALFYEAETRTLLGTAALAAGTAPASGAGSNVVRATLTGSYQGILSTQATGGGAHLSHVGSFRVYARVYVGATGGTSGVTSVALEWSQGDFSRYTRNAEFVIQPATQGRWLLIDLGLVTLQPGVTRWEGRIIASCTSTFATTSFDVDYLMLFPADYGFGIAKGVSRTFTPSVFSARDEFDQTAGNLSAKVMPLGGSWVTSGGSTDFVVDAVGHRVGHSALAAGGARYASAGTTNYTNVAVQADWSTSNSESVSNGVHARWTDVNNFLALGYFGGPSYPTSSYVGITKTVAGTPTTLGTWGTSPRSNWRLRLTVFANGVWVFAVNDVPIRSGYDPDLATGGTLATGKAGLWSNPTVADTTARYFDNFWIAVPPVDASVMGSQSLQVAWDGVTREDAAGAVYVPVSSYEGDLLLVPPSGPEGRNVRVQVKNVRLTSGDVVLDDLSARLFITPRFLT